MNLSLVGYEPIIGTGTNRLNDLGSMIGVIVVTESLCWTF
jgi:hypothetical protein